MQLDELADLITTTLKPLGFGLEDGEEFRAPPLDLLSYWQRGVRLSRVPIVGKAKAVVALAHQPADLGRSNPLADGWLKRVIAASHARYPPWPSGEGLTLGLTTIFLTRDTLTPDDETSLDHTLTQHRPRSSRVVPLAIFLINLEQGAIAQSFGVAMPDVFPEPVALAEVLSTKLGRFMPSLPHDFA
jgi:hypothetical protein